MKLEETKDSFRLSWVTEVDRWGIYVWGIPEMHMKAVRLLWYWQPVGGIEALDVPPKIRESVECGLAFLNGNKQEEWAGMDAEDMFNSIVGGVSRD